jgi:hypothetical protein
VLGIVTRADLVSAHMLNDDKVEDKGPEQSSSAYLQPTIDLDANEGLWTLAVEYSIDHSNLLSIQYMPTAYLRTQKMVKAMRRKQ